MASAAQHLRREQKLTGWPRPALSGIFGPSWPLSAGAPVVAFFLLTILAHASDVVDVGWDRCDDGHRAGSVGTSFFGVKDTGSKFVYVIDRSASMEGGEGIEVVPFTSAKEELKTSIEQLNERQQFQIVFYNEEPFVLVNDNGRFDCFFGSDSQRRDAVRQIGRVRPGGGTNHVSALQAALDLAPDVVFLLTDGEEPALTDGDVAGIVQRSRGARIHCIQFGTEPGQNSGNWLQAMAKETGGEYVYRDVTQLEQ